MPTRNPPHDYPHGNGQWDLFAPDGTDLTDWRAIKRACTRANPLNPFNPWRTISRNQLAEDVLQNPAVLVVLNLVRRINACDGLEGLVRAFPVCVYRHQHAWLDA